MSTTLPSAPGGPVELRLSTDEALVLLEFLTRELWQRDEERLRPLFEHPAEAHALRALLQELVPPTAWSGNPETAAAVFAAARQRLLERHC